MTGSARRCGGRPTLNYHNSSAGRSPSTETLRFQERVFIFLFAAQH